MSINKNTIIINSSIQFLLLAYSNKSGAYFVANLLFSLFRTNHQFSTLAKHVNLFKKKMTYTNNNANYLMVMVLVCVFQMARGGFRSNIDFVRNGIKMYHTFALERIAPKALYQNR